MEPVDQISLPPTRPATRLLASVIDTAIMVGVREIGSGGQMPWGVSDATRHRENKNFAVNWGYLGGQIQMGFWSKIGLNCLVKLGPMVGLG